MRALIFSALLLGLPLYAQEYGNPPVFHEKPCIRTFLYGDFFFASAREDGLTYALRSNDGNVLHGKYLEPSDCWRPGFRIGFGSHLIHDCWEINADWTCFQSMIVQTAHAALAPVGSTFLVPLFIDAESYTQWISNSSVQEAKEQWNLLYNALLFVLGRPYYLSKELAVRPQIGLFAAWIDQDVNVSYRGDASAAGVVSYQTSIGNDSSRVGPCLSTKLDWYVRRKFRLFGALAAAICYRNLFFQEMQASIGNSGGDFRITLRERTHRLQPWLDGQLGLAWGSFIHCSRNFIEVALQYESQYFWHEFESRVLYEQISGVQDRNLNNLGDLSIQSVALRVRLDF